MARFAAIALLLSFVMAAEGAQIRVTNTNDSGPGSLRAAIELANATVERDVIMPAFETCPFPCRVEVLSALPAITHPVRMQYVAIDGTSAGAEGVHGLVVDAELVVLQDVRVTDFSGDGIVVNGTAYLEFCEGVWNQRNGIRIEGGATVFGCRFNANRQYGIRIAYGARSSVIGRPDIECAILCFPWGAGNEVLGNGSGGIRVEGTGIVLDSNEVGNLAAPNGGHGIEILRTGNEVINNRVTHNTGAGIMLTARGALRHNSGDCNRGGFIAGNVTEPPVILAARSDPTVLTASGTFRGAPNRDYTVELHETPDCTKYAYTLIGSATFTTDATGNAQWTAHVASGQVTSIFAVVNRPASEESSSVSAPFATTVTNDSRADLSVVTTGPAVAAHGQVIEIVTVVTNHGPSGVAYAGIDLPRVVDGTRSIRRFSSSGECSDSFCYLRVLGAGRSATIRDRLEITAVAGSTIHYAASTSEWYVPAIDPNPANNASALSIPVVVPAAVPGLSPWGLGALAVMLAAAGLWVQRAS